MKTLSPEQLARKYQTVIHWKHNPGLGWGCGCNPNQIGLLLQWGFTIRHRPGDPWSSIPACFIALSIGPVFLDFAWRESDATAHDFGNALQQAMQAHEANRKP